MSGELEGRVAIVTGAARGQGRSHALRLAEEGASIVAVDICAPVGDLPYRPAGLDDLDQTCELLAASGASVEAVVADVRHLDELTAAIVAAVQAIGRVDVVVANAGIAGGAPIESMTGEEWQVMIDTNLTGVWNTIKASLAAGLGREPGASVVITSSANGGMKAPPNLSHYASAKHGLVGLMRSLANELGPRGIRVNTVHPTAVDTEMIQNDFTYRLFRPDLNQPRREDVVELFRSFHSLPIPWIEPVDVSNAVAFLASSRARYITGVMLPVDGGLSAR